MRAPVLAVLSVLLCACGGAPPSVEPTSAVIIPPSTSSTPSAEPLRTAATPSSTPDVPSDDGPPSPATGRVKVTFTLATEGARVTLVRDDDRRELPMFPITVAFDPSKPWTLHATKPGFCELVRPLDLAHGPPVQRVDIELRPGCK